MRIAIFTDAFLPQANGMVSYILDTAVELVKRNNQVLVFAPKPKRGMRLDLKNFPFKTILLPSLPALLYPDVRLTIPSLPKIIWQLSKFQPEVISVQDPLTVGTEGVIVGKLLKIPIAITFHTFFMDEDMLSYVKLKKRAKLLQTPLWKLTTCYHNLADCVICPSLVSQKELEKHGLKKPTIIINNGIDLNKIRSKMQEAVNRNNYGLGVNDKVGIYVGRLAQDKSLDILLYAWKIVAEKISGAKLLIVGEGPQAVQLKTLADTLKLADNVIFTGGMRREEIIDSGIYRLADVFVTASKIENQSISMLEAMAFGLAIVAINARGTPELVDNTNGILVEPDKPELLAEAVVKILTDDKMRESLARGSLLKAKNFDLKESTKRLEAVFRVLAKFKTY